MGDLSEEEIALSGGSSTPRGSAALMLVKKASGIQDSKNLDKDNNIYVKHPINK